MDFLDMGLMVWLVVLAAWGVARLWLTPAEIGERLGRGLRQVRRGRVGRFAARHRKATTVVLGLAVLAVAPFALSAALLLAIAAVMAWVFPDRPFEAISTPVYVVNADELRGGAEDASERSSAEHLQTRSFQFGAEAEYWASMGADWVPGRGPIDPGLLNNSGDD